MGFYIFEPDGFIVRLAFLSFSDFLSFNLWFPHSFLILISTKHYKLHMLHQIWLLSQKINKFCFVLCIIWIYFSRRTRKIRTHKHTHSFLHFYDVPEEISRFLVVQMTKVIELPLPLSPPTPWPFIAGYEAKNVCQTKRRKKK